ncbi:expressed unknown protein [Seminavis robusta]|uniref:Transmembrane protein n=1 Tax=Seminavis robusta TaxID=568900 RepID=A0A9N8H329_9STRA|nr:expressed unknown protein [Seminavis robusta]|eukprot:Sro19_g013460.2  (669) ;mRNA; r:85456-87635
MTKIHMIGRLLSYIFLLLSAKGSYGRSLQKQTQGYGRVLQDQALAAYEMEVAATYGFDVNGTAPETLNIEEIQELLRLTEIYYKRVFASGFSQTYQDVLVTYKSHDWQWTQEVLAVTFDAKISFRRVEFVPLPATDLVLNALTNVISEAYIQGYVMQAQPPELFLWANSTSMSAIAKVVPTPFPTEEPVAAPTRAPVPAMVNDVVVAATSSPSQLSTVAVTSSLSQSSQSIDGVATVAFTSPPSQSSQLNDLIPAQEQTASSGTGPSQSSPLNDLQVPPTSSGTGPTESSPLNDLQVPPASSETGEAASETVGATEEDNVDSPSEETTAINENSSADVFAVTSTSSSQTEEDEQIGLEMPEATGDAFGSPFEPTKSEAFIGDTDKFASLVATTTVDEFTAPNLFYWMVAIRFMYLLVQLALGKWSRPYQASEKKVHLASYWVNLSIQVPILAVLAWAILALSGDDSEVVTAGIQTFSHSAMALLSVCGVELFLRGHEMNKVLFANRVVFIATMLYVMEEDSSNMKAPLDLIMFGTIEALGTCIELSSQVLMIYYRFWSDSQIEVRDSIRPRVSIVLQLCLSLGFFLKVAFVVVSVVWYVLKLDDLNGSSLIWIVPLVRIVQAPLLVRSFHLQLLLFNQVATASQRDEVITKEMVVEFGPDEEMSQEDV